MSDIFEVLKDSLGLVQVVQDVVVNGDFVSTIFREPKLGFRWPIGSGKEVENDCVILD